MRRKIELTGQRFGRLLVFDRAHKGVRGEIFWNCLCDCGNRVAVRGGHMMRGNSTSCGCLQREKSTLHGMTKTPTFKSWESMKQRCLNPKAPDFKNYGGRGIRIHDSWIAEFANFLADMGVRPENTSLDRINVNGDYEPGNCRWATRSEQQQNRRISLVVEWNGKSRSVGEWASITGLDARIIYERIKAKWKIEDVMTKPNRKRKTQSSPA